MADHTVYICNNWHGLKGDKVTFVNDTNKDCVISHINGTTWPFTDASPIPAKGSISPGGTATTHLNNPLPDGTYPYDVSCCKKMDTPKNVTVP